MEGKEVPLSEAQVAEKTKKLVEKLGQHKVRLIAALALAAAGLFGSGKLEGGIGVGVEVPNPLTGKQVSVGVFASSTEEHYPLGIPEIPAYDEKGRRVFPYQNLEAYQVKIGNASFGVYMADLYKADGESVKTIGIYPGFQTTR